MLRRRLGALLVALVPCSVRAQSRPDTVRVDTTRAAIDSLMERLARAEAAIAVLRQQVATESQSTVHTRSRFSMDISARVLTNVAFTLNPTNDPGVPQVATQSTEEGHTLGLSVRQTRLGAAVTVRDVLGATLDADMDLDFFGGGRDANGNRPLFPEPRLRTARAVMSWPKTTVLIGSETPLISDLDPLSLASVGITEFSGAADLWNWLAQARVSQLLGGRKVRWTVEGAVMEPFASSTYEPTRSGGGDAGERSGKPFLEGRIGARWGPEDPDAPMVDVRDAVIGEGPSEIGVGVHRGWVAIDDKTNYASQAVSIDARIVIAPRVELRGEGYRGSLLAGLGGGGIGQNFGRPVPVNGVTPPVGSPLYDTAGWLQLNVRPAERWLGGVGCGIDRVDDAEHPDRRQNTVCAAHLRWTPVQPLLLGLEYRQLNTLYSTGWYHAHHFNLAIGIDL